MTTAARAPKPRIATIDRAEAADRMRWTILFSVWLHVSALIVGRLAPWDPGSPTGPPPPVPPAMSIALLTSPSGDRPALHAETDDAHQRITRSAVANSTTTPTASSERRPTRDRSASAATERATGTTSRKTDPQAPTTRAATTAPERPKRSVPTAVHANDAPRADEDDPTKDETKPDRSTTADPPRERPPPPPRAQFDRFVHVDDGDTSENPNAALIAKKTVRATEDARTAVTSQYTGTPGETPDSSASRARVAMNGRAEPRPSRPTTSTQSDVAPQASTAKATSPDATSARDADPSPTTEAKPSKYPHSAPRPGQAAGGAAAPGASGVGAPTDGHDATSGGEAPTARGAATGDGGTPRGGPNPNRGAAASRGADPSGLPPAPNGSDPLRAPGPAWWRPAAARVIPAVATQTPRTGTARGADPRGAHAGAGEQKGTGGRASGEKKLARTAIPKPTADLQSSPNPVQEVANPQVVVAIGAAILAPAVAVDAQLTTSAIKPATVTEARDAVDELQAALGLTPVDHAEIQRSTPTEATIRSRFDPDGSNQTVLDDDTPFRDVVFINTRTTALGAYMDEVDTILKRRWYERDLSLEDRARGIGGRVTVAFYVSRRGKVNDVTLLQSSGHPDLDALAIAAVPKRLPAPGRRIPGGRLALKFQFDYRNPIVGKVRR